MRTALEHPLVTDYLRTLDRALAGLEAAAAAELSEQLAAHIVEALPPDASDDLVAEVLAALGPPAAVAAAAALPWPHRQSLRRRLGIRARRVRLRTWLVVTSVVLAICLAAGAVVFWESQPSLWSGSAMWWYSIDRARNVDSQAALATQSTTPLRPGKLQGYVVEIVNTSDLTMRIQGPQSGDSLASPTAQVAVATTSGPQDDPYTDRYDVGGVIPPHNYRWVRVIWRSWHCLFNVPGGWSGINQLTLRVRVGWITRTEIIQLPTEFALSHTKAALEPAFCKAHGGQPTP